MKSPTCLILHFFNEDLNWSSKGLLCPPAEWRPCCIWPARPCEASRCINLRALRLVFVGPSPMWSPSERPSGTRQHLSTTNITPKSSSPQAAEHRQNHTREEQRLKLHRKTKHQNKSHRYTKMHSQLQLHKSFYTPVLKCTHVYTHIKKKRAPNNRWRVHIKAINSGLWVCESQYQTSGIKKTHTLGAPQLQ